MSLYLSLSLYILSLLLALVLLITGKRQRSGWFKAALSLHLLSLLFSLYYLFQKHNIPEGSILRFAFLFTLCTGLVAGGLVVRAEIRTVYKVYFSLYFLSLLLFLVSPSRFAGFLSRGDLENSAPGRFHLVQNFFLEEQRASALMPGGNKTYKLVQQFGLFHKTIRRDITFDTQPDSVHVLNSVTGNALAVRIYFQRRMPPSLVTDSTELTLSLTPGKTDPIQRIHY